MRLVKMRIKLAKGTTRNVILCSNYAIKIPTFISLKLFLNGWLANIQESTFGCVGFDCLAQVERSFFKDFVIIQKRLIPVNHKGLFWVEQKRLEVTSNVKYLHNSDVKPENYGYDKGILKRLDYGS